MYKSITVQVKHGSDLFEWCDRNAHCANNLYNDVLQSADIVRYICGDRYSAESFQARNEWMVDRSARVIAAFNGEPGGTLNTIRYAEKTGVPVVRLDLCEAVAEKLQLFSFAERHGQVLRLA